MIEIETKHKSAGKFAWFANYDARMKSIVNGTRYNDHQKVRAERIRLALGLVVKAEQIFIEYRKRFISVKVHGPQYINKKQLNTLENDWELENIVKIKTSQGFTYRVPA